MPEAPEDPLPLAYQDYKDVFSKADAEVLPPHRESVDHSIDLEPGIKLPFGRVYNMSESELKALKAYIDEHLANGFIQRSTSPAASPILFVKKKDGSLRLCVDYRGFNSVTIKNRYPLPLISGILDRMRGTKLFTKLDLRGAYNLIRIKERDECKTAFRTRYGQYEYRVMPFGLTKAPATFQSYMDDCLRPYLDDFAVTYLNDILIYSKNQQEHEKHVKLVLERLREFGLYCKAEKCEFSVPRVGFLGYIISAKGIEMEQDRLATIEDWPQPKSIHDVQVFLGFVNFYRRFIRHYPKITAAITDLLRTTGNSINTSSTKADGNGNSNTSGSTKSSSTKARISSNGSQRFEWTIAANAAFQQLKQAFQEAPILTHFNPEKSIILQTDASGFALAGILNQFDDFGVLRSVAFCSKKICPAEQNYDTYDREQLAIVESFKGWRHYLEGGAHTVRVRCDHKNLV